LTVQERIEPEVIVYKSGLDISIHCSTDVPESTKFFFNNGDLPSNTDQLKTQRQVLIIKKMKEYNVGLYECHGFFHTSKKTLAQFAAFSLIKKS